MAKAQLKTVTEAMEALNQKIAEATATYGSRGIPVALFTEKTALLQKQRKLQDQVSVYERHLEQYKVQRPKVDDIKKNLKVGEGVIMRDFVNSYNYLGTHIKNLVLVLLHRTRPGGELEQINLSNLCSDPDTQSCDRFYYRDVMHFHLSPQDDHHSGLLSGFSKLYVVGDHGMHFSSKSTFWLHSTWFTTFDVEIEDVYLCSYHAYNLCDGVGAQTTRCGEALAKDGRGPEHDVELAVAVNAASAGGNHYAYPFSAIARDDSFFPAEVLDDVGVHNLRKACHVKYAFAVGDTMQRLEGIILCKITSADPVYTLYDLLPSTRTEPLCWPCSNLHQRPIFGDDHMASPDCVAYKVSDEGALDLTRPALLKILPDHNRFGVLGLQKAAAKVQKKKAAAGKLAKGGFVYYCRADSTCPKVYVTPGGANRHMTGRHNCTDPSLLFTVEKKSKAARPRAPQPSTKERKRKNSAGEAPKQKKARCKPASSETEEEDLSVFGDSDEEESGYGSEAEEEGVEAVEEDDEAPAPADCDEFCKQLPAFGKTLAIKGLVEGTPFHIVREYSERPLAGQFYGKASTADAWVARYNLAWMDQGDEMEIQESQVSRLVAKHGTRVEVFEAEWESADVLVSEIELDANGCLTDQAHDDISDALPLKKQRKRRQTAPGRAALGPPPTTLSPPPPSHLTHQQCNY